MKRHMCRARAASLVTTSPPSPVVMCLPCCRLKQPIVAEGANNVAVIARQKRLRTIFNHRQMHAAVPGARMLVHIAGVAKQMRHDDGPGPIAQAGFDGRWR